jgi:hypothetical protein
MDISLLSLLFFIIITIGYFLALKPKLTLDQLAPDCYNDYKNSIFPKLALYLLIVCLSQFLLNTAYLTNKCGGEVKNNIGPAALYTFFPWLIIFGIIIAILIIFPGFKSAFSDVIGYFAIAGSAKTLFANIMLDADLNKKIQETDETKRAAIASAADTLVKMLGNKSILINQITPDNFLSSWDLLEALMKDKIKADPNVLNTYKAQLLDLVVLKDNIGEAFWYVYTAILISSVVYYNLASRGCVKSAAQIKAGYDKYQEDQAAKEAEEKANTATVVLN